jgi:hypothetical protein
MIETIVSIAAIIAVVGGLLFFILSSLRRKEGKLPIVVYFICAFISLSALNWLGYNSGDDGTPWIFRIGTTMGITMTMFGQEYDGGHAASLAQTHFLYGAAMTVCYLGALLCTILVIIQVFFKSAKNAVRVTINAKRRETIVVAGIGNATELLLQSMNEKEKRAVTIILDSEDDELKKECLGRGLTVIAAVVDEISIAKAGLYRGKSHSMAHNKVFISLLPDDERNLTAARAVIAGMRKNGNASFKAYIQYTDIDRAEHFKFSEQAAGAVCFFNPHEKVARAFLSRRPVTGLMPKDFIDTSAARMKKKYRIGHVFAGFGNANIQMLKKSLIIDQLPGCDYRALAIDADIEKQAAIFRNSSRGLFRQTATEEEAALFFPPPAEVCDIEFASMNTHSREFYERVIAEVKANDFTVVVVSLGDDKLSAETAMEIRQWAYENDIPPEKLRLFIKVKKHSALSANDVLNPAGSDITIEPFGFEEDIFNFNAITDEDTDMLAVHIAENYSGGGSGSRWENLINHERDSNRYAALSIKPKLNLMGFDLVFDRNAEQDPAVIAAFASAYADSEVQENLARLEHQRWNLYYLVSGWLPLPKAEVTAASHKNQRKRKHACITTFEGLEELARLRGALASKDFSVFDTRPYDYDLMNNLLGNIKDTKYRIVKVGSEE